MFHRLSRVCSKSKSKETALSLQLNFVLVAAILFIILQETGHYKISNILADPCHVFLVVRLHKQVSEFLTIFPCQGEVSTPDFPRQGTFAHYSPSIQGIFPCQGKIAHANGA